MGVARNVIINNPSQSPKRPRSTSLATCAVAVSLCFALSSCDGGLGANLLAWNPTTNSVRTVLALGDVLDDPTVGFELTEGGFPLWYRLWAVCGDDQIGVYDRMRNAIRRFAADGTELAPTTLPPVRFTEATPRQFAQAIFGLAAAEATGAVGRRLTATDSAEFINAGMQQIKGNPRQLAAYLPRYVDFRCADDGTAWVQPFDLDVGGLAGTPTWFRLALDGRSQEVRLPDRFDAFRFTSTKIWGVQRDELDVATVAWIDLPTVP